MYQQRIRRAAWLGGILSILLAASFYIGAAQAQISTSIIRVAPNGTDVRNCGSVAQPCRTPFAAAQEFVLGKGTYTGEIRIAGGTYSSSTDGNIIAVRSLPSNLVITGGYSTSNWSTSDPIANPTIIDGQNSKRGVFITADSATAPQCNVLVQNLTIQNGLAPSFDTYGGGISIDNCMNVVVSNVTVKNSRAIGQDNTNISPTSPGAGGGISVRGNDTIKASLNLTNVTLEENQANGGNESSAARGGLGAGGGLYAVNSSVSASGLTVTGNSVKGGNTASGSGNAGVQRADGLGGGIAIIQAPSFSFDELVVNGNSATGGNATQLGGLGLGGGVFIELSAGTIRNAVISGNSGQGGTASTGGAALGGGIFSTDNVLTVDRSEVINNTATAATNGDASGGGIYLTTGSAEQDNSLTATNTIVASNTLAANGTGTVFGGGIQCADSTVNLSHMTLSNNELTGSAAKNGWALTLIGFNNSQSCTGSMSNSIVANHAGNPIHANDFAGNITISRTLAEGNSGTFLDNPAGRPVTVSGTFSGNPNFLNAGSNNYRIGSGSAAIDQAVGSTATADVDGQVRPVGTAADVGADEFQVEVIGSAGETSIALSWEAPPGTTVTRYEVRYQKPGNANNATEGASPISAGTSLNITLTGLTPKATYTITIVAFNGNTQVAESAPLAIFTDPDVIYLPFVVR